MKVSKIFSGLFAVLGALVMAASVTVCLLSRNAQPRMLESPEAAAAQAQRMMDALCAGDYETAAGFVYGQPDFGTGEPEDAVTRLLWDAFTQGMTYEFTGLCYVTDSGFGRDASVTVPDLSGVTAQLPQRAQALLEEQTQPETEEAADQTRAYTAQQVDQALLEAARQALSENTDTITRDVTLNLIYRDDAWWVVPDQTLLQLISGIQ